MRIISLIPEATEILQALGLGDRIVPAPFWGVAGAAGRDPADLTPPIWDPAHLTVLTWASYDLTADALHAARPTLIFTSETSAGGGMPRHLVRRIVAVAASGPRPSVYALEPRSLGQILSDVKTVGDAVGRQASARGLIEALRARIDVVSLRSARAVADGVQRRIVLLERADPPRAAGWWLAELVGLAGGFDVLDGVGRPPRAVTWDEIRAARPDLVICPGDGEALIPGPGAVDLLESLAALILQGDAGTIGRPI